MIKIIVKWVLIIGAIVIIGLTMIHLYFKDSVLHNTLLIEPRKPKNQIPTTYEIDWWLNQDSIHIDTFKVKVLDSKLNLFNGKSLVSYTIIGHIGYKGHWIPSIKGVHISERLNKDTSLSFDRITELTPFAKAESDEKEKLGVVKFNFTNEMIINSNHWGENRLKFICFDKEQIIELVQKK